MVHVHGHFFSLRFKLFFFQVGIGGTAQFFHVPGGKRAWGTLLNGIAKRCCDATSDSTEPSSRSNSTAQESEVNVELSSIYSKTNGAAVAAKSSTNKTVAHSGEATSTPGRTIVSKGQLQVFALLQHPRFGRLCLAYFLVSLAFETPFIHLTRFALDEGKLRMLFSVQLFQPEKS